MSARMAGRVGGRSSRPAGRPRARRPGRPRAHAPARGRACLRPPRPCAPACPRRRPAPAAASCWSAGPWHLPVPSGTLRAPPMCSAANSAGSHTSITTFSRLIRRIPAPFGLTASAPPPCRGSAASSAAPEATRSAARSSCREGSSRKFGVGRGRAQGLARVRIIEFAPIATRRRPTAMYKLVLIRHGESTWNLENRFTGWTDVELTATGVEQAARPAACLKARPAARVRRGLHLGAQARDLDHAEPLPGHDGPRLAAGRQDWRLNERHYGGLRGLNKADNGQAVRRRAGAGLAPQLRHPPPALASMIRAASARTRATRLNARAGAADRVPEGHGRARAAVLERGDRPRPSRSGQRIVLAAHGNSIRALVKYLDNIGDDDIVGVNIPNGIRLVYEAGRRPEADQGPTTWAMPGRRQGRRRGRQPGQGLEPDHGFVGD